MTKRKKSLRQIRKDEARIEHRRWQVAAILLTLHNPSVRRVSEALKQLPNPISVSKSTVHRDITVCREEWVAARFADMDEVIGTELAKLSLAEEQTWRALNKSADPAIKTFTYIREILVGGKIKTLTNTHTESVERETDPRLLGALIDIFERRAKLLGLDAPKGIDLTSGGRTLAFSVDIGAPAWEPVVLPVRDRKRLKLLEAGAERAER